MPTDVPRSLSASASLVFELAGPADYAPIDDLVVRAYTFDYGPRSKGDDPMRSSAVRAQDFDVWTARDRDSGELVGTVTTSRADGSPLHEDTPDDEIDFRLLAVDPGARRRGIGAALTQFVVELGAQSDRRAVSLKSAPEMAGAHRLYESLGFERLPERDGLYRGGVWQFDLYTYVLDVGPVTPAGAARG